MKSDPEREMGRAPSGEDADLTAVLDALGDETSREILCQTNREVATVGDLADACAVSEATVHRRLSRLGELGLVEPSPWPDGADDYAYTGAVDTLTLQLQEGRLELRLDDRGGLSEAVCTLEEMIRVERTRIDRDNRTVELGATATDELFDILLKYYQR